MEHPNKGGEITEKRETKEQPLPDDPPGHTAKMGLGATFTEWLDLN